MPRTSGLYNSKDGGTVLVTFEREITSEEAQALADSGFKTRGAVGELVASMAVDQSVPTAERRDGQVAVNFSKLVSNAIAHAATQGLYMQREKLLKEEQEAAQRRAAIEAEIASVEGGG